MPLAGQKIPRVPASVIGETSRLSNRKRHWTLVQHFFRPRIPCWRRYQGGNLSLSWFQCVYNVQETKSLPLSVSLEAVIEDGRKNIVSYCSTYTMFIVTLICMYYYMYVFTYVRISYTFTWNVEDCEQPYASYPISKWKIGFRGALRVHSELLAGNLPLSWFSHSRNGVVTFWSSVFILVIVVEVHWKCGKNDGENALLACILSSRPAQMKDRRRWNLSVVTYRFLDCVR